MYEHLPHLVEGDSLPLLRMYIGEGAVPKDEIREAFCKRSNPDGSVLIGKEEACCLSFHQQRRLLPIFLPINYASVHLGIHLAVGVPRAVHLLLIHLD